MKIPNVWIFVGTCETGKKVTVITWNSLKTRNSLSGEFWVLSCFFCPMHIFRDTWDHVWKIGWKVCLGLLGLPSVKNVFQVLRFLK